MEEEEVDFSGSVAWETNNSTDHQTTSSSANNNEQDYQQQQQSSSSTTTSPTSHSNLPLPSSSSANNLNTNTTNSNGNKSNIYNLKVKDSEIELEGNKDQFVSYLIVAKTELPHFTSKNLSTRKRFTDFTFLREHLVKDFPTCVVPPLPEKHRMEYLTGDRFSPEFIETRRIDLQRFLERLARHPKLSRTSLFQNFLESTEWNVYKHTQLAHPPSPDAPLTLLDNLSDTLLNAFSRIKKQDERFVDLKITLDQFEEGLTSIERLAGRSKSRLGDLGGDYEDLATSIQGLGYLESGITEPLIQFERKLLSFGSIIRTNSQSTSSPFLQHLHSLLAYSNSFKQVLKMRDQKQLDFEDLSGYLSGLTSERERLVGGFNYGLGIGNYLKEKLEGIKGEQEGGREGKIKRLEVKIKELQEATITSSTTLTTFNSAILTEELQIFQSIKKSEMKELLLGFCDGQIEMFKEGMKGWEEGGSVQASS